MSHNPSGHSLSNSYRPIDGIYQSPNQAYNPWFETQYSSGDEPWSYSRRGGELYRHTFTIEQLRQFCPGPSSLLELGCGSGLMTARFTAFTGELYAADVSLSAVKACKLRCDPLASKHNCQIQYYVTTAPGLPFDNDSFEVVTLCDGLIGWWFTQEQKQAALKDTYRVLQKGGYVILTDYATPDQFKPYINLVRQSELAIMKISYLYDRPWYLLEALAKRLPFKNLLQSIVASTRIAKLLHRAGSILGSTAARHIIIIARKE
jgi:ubiquinone/menaquinone biosynthesis C-methylase UbiE